MIFVILFALILGVKCQTWDSDDCGNRNTNYADQKIVGGTQTNRNEYPWQVSLQTSWGGHFCGGSIVSSTVIVTAAHCVDDDEKIPVLAGAWNRGLSEETQQTEMGTATQHPNYNGIDLDNDCAVVVLDNPLSLNKAAVYPVCRPKNVIHESGAAWVSGWGTLSEGSPHLAYTLRHVQVDVITIKKCDEMYKYDDITANMLCAFKEGGGKDACQGDSGGPLVLDESGDNHYSLIGIVSWGHGCGRPEKPGVYARTTKFFDFVDSFMD